MPGPFVCYTCQKTFTTQEARQIHELRHGENRPHSCTFENCGYTFKTKRDLARHMRAHTGEIFFQCEVCKVCFTRGFNLNRHVKTVHANQPMTQNFPTHPLTLNDWAVLEEFIEPDSLHPRRSIGTRAGTSGLPQPSSSTQSHSQQAGGPIGHQRQPQRYGPMATTSSASLTPVRSRPRDPVAAQLNAADLD
ncbi:C2H2-type zinc finger protein [Xenorhabdus eapokensis]|uniref:C2H2 transcription factor n=1 Tax=Xenorhabdus eapokensis TaxID=1873482 RepID=A0A1Q5TQC4_9GAMM|nr:C2H2-type zinc finger protein [Xenorhabdus eapokensis]OKP02436.1 C2H2 transcription factor [Xenorhabdus eapokensis]